MSDIESIREEARQEAIDGRTGRDTDRLCECCGEYASFDEYHAEICDDCVDEEKCRKEAEQLRERRKAYVRNKKAS